MQRFDAYRLHEPKGDDKPRLLRESLTVNDLSPGDVVVRIAYSSINYKDALMTAGRNRILREYPRIGGVDYTGEVLESNDSRFKPGDPVVVYGFGIGVSHDGGHSQVGRVPADWLMRLPEGLSLFEAAVVGVAGYTSALALHHMEHDGLSPEQGPVVVSGASGGSGSFAVAMLAARGYEVHAMSGKEQAHDFLRELGAAKVIPPAQAPQKPLEHAIWAGAIDTVGAEVLSGILAQTCRNGVVAAFGNAGGNDFQSSILPFILRGVKLLGINGNSSEPLRQTVWQKICHEYRLRNFHLLADVIDFDAVPATCEAMLARRTQGRVVIDMAA